MIQMTRLSILFALLIAIGAAVSACAPQAAPTPAPQPATPTKLALPPTPTPEKGTLEAVKAKAAPASAADAAWNTAPSLQVTLKGEGEFKDKSKSVTARALYTDSDLHLLFRWKDESQSLTKEAWRYDGVKWAKQKGNEDRLAILWEITPIDGFASKACATACHDSAKEKEKWYFATNAATERADLWHWKSYRSDPLGFADDSWLGESDPKASPPTGRRNDPGGGGDSRNETPEKDRPALMADSSKPVPALKPGAPGGLLAKDNTVPIKDYAAFKAGDVLGYRILSQPSGSRGDIKALSEYRDGEWTLILSRKLTTGNEDDVAFALDKPYNLGMAVFDDSGDENSYDSTALRLKFRPAP
ncbi:MAG: hypothetical protein HW403_246 [Dehalococcoidia bacterium]|nr:hypothetical protein [Dehalococcoidia bacterium]